MGGLVEALVRRLVAGRARVLGTQDAEIVSKATQDGDHVDNIVGRHLLSSNQNRPAEPLDGSIQDGEPQSGSYTGPADRPGRPVRSR